MRVTLCSRERVFDNSMYALMWLIAITISLVSITYLLSAVIASVRAGKPFFAGLMAVAGIALTMTLFSRLHPVVPAVVAVASGLGAMAILRLVTRNAQHSSENTRLSAAHLTLLAGSFIFLIPFAWLISTSLKTDEEQAIFPPIWIPTQQVEIGALASGLKRPDGKPLRLSHLTDGTQVVEVEDLPSGEVVVQPLLNGQADASKPSMTIRRDQLTKERKVSPRWENYSEALAYLPKETTYGLTFLKNTLILTILGAIGTVLSSSLVAYAFARVRFPGKDVLFLMVLATMMVPAAVTMMPQFLIFRELGWIDTLRPLWVPAFFGSAFNIFLLRQFFLSIPTELEDAARIDGCGPFGIYWRVMLPLVKPALAAIAILAVLGAWNNFQGPLIYLSSPENMPMAYGLQLYQQQHSGEPGLLMAASTLVIMPIIVLFFFTQRYFIEGVSLTGLGGR